MSSCYALCFVGFLFLAGIYRCSGSNALDARVIPIVSSSKDSFDLERSVFMDTLTTKLSIAANIPIFEFGQDVSNFLIKVEDPDGRVDPTIIMKLELIFFEYMNKLSYYYYRRFSDSQTEILSNGLLLTKSNLIEERDHSLRQCRKAMQSALPSNLAVESWRFEGPLLELESDINSLIESILPNLQPEEEEVARSMRSRRPRFFRKLLKRSKWIGIQVALLAFNFAQNEWHRRSMKHLADRRLAEVPEFPLL